MSSQTHFNPLGSTLEEAELELRDTETLQRKSLLRSEHQEWEIYVLSSDKQLIQIRSRSSKALREKKKLEEKYEILQLVKAIQSTTTACNDERMQAYILQPPMDAPVSKTQEEKNEDHLETEGRQTSCCCQHSFASATCTNPHRLKERDGHQSTPCKPWVQPVSMWHPTSVIILGEGDNTVARFLPYDVIGTIAEYMSFEDLLPSPSFHLSSISSYLLSAKQRFHIPAPWCTCKTFCYYFFKEASHRIVAMGYLPLGPRKVLVDDWVVDRLPVIMNFYLPKAMRFLLVSLEAAMTFAVRDFLEEEVEEEQVDPIHKCNAHHHHQYEEGDGSEERERAKWVLFFTNCVLFAFHNDKDSRTFRNTAFQIFQTTKTSRGGGSDRLASLFGAQGHPGCNVTFDEDDDETVLTLFTSPSTDMARAPIIPKKASSSSSTSDHMRANVFPLLCGAVRRNHLSTASPILFLEHAYLLAVLLLLDKGPRWNVRRKTIMALEKYFGTGLAPTWSATATGVNKLLLAKEMMMEEVIEEMSDGKKKKKNTTTEKGASKTGKARRGFWLDTLVVALPQQNFSSPETRPLSARLSEASTVLLSHILVTGNYRHFTISSGRSAFFPYRTGLALARIITGQVKHTFCETITVVAGEEKFSTAKGGVVHLQNRRLQNNDQMMSLASLQCTGGQGVLEQLLATALGCIPRCSQSSSSAFSLMENNGIHSSNHEKESDENSFSSSLKIAKNIQTISMTLPHWKINEFKRNFENYSINQEDGDMMRIDKDGNNKHSPTTEKQGTSLLDELFVWDETRSHPAKQPPPAPTLRKQPPIVSARPRLFTDSDGDESDPFDDGGVKNPPATTKKEEEEERYQAGTLIWKRKNDNQDDEREGSPAEDFKQKERKFLQEKSKDDEDDNFFSGKKKQRAGRILSKNTEKTVSLFDSTSSEDF